MDRDKRWERVEKAFGAMVLGNGEKATDPVAAVKRSYERGITDEFIEPITIVDERNEPVGLIREERRLHQLQLSRRPRARDYDGADGQDAGAAIPVAGAQEPVLRDDDAVRQDASICRSCCRRSIPNNILANVMAQVNCKNLRVAETEKYAHVTYFFNGGAEKPFPGEEREMVASPKVATYDLKPEMSADGVADVVVNAIGQGSFDVIVMNFANADMVGHSGKMDPTVRAVETGRRLPGPHLHSAPRRMAVAGSSPPITAMPRR